MATITREFTAQELQEGARALQGLIRERLPVTVLDAVLTTKERVDKALAAYGRLAQAVLDQHKYRDDDGVEIPILGYRDAKGRIQQESPVQPLIHLNDAYRGQYKSARKYAAGQIVMHGGFVYRALQSGKLPEPGTGDKAAEAWEQLVRRTDGGDAQPYSATDRVPIARPGEYRRKMQAVEARLWEVRIVQFPLSALNHADEEGLPAWIEAEKIWRPMLEGAEVEADDYDVDAMLAELDGSDVPAGDGAQPRAADVEVRPNDD